MKNKIMFEFSNTSLYGDKWSVYIIRKGWFGKEKREQLYATKTDTIVERKSTRVTEYRYCKNPPSNAVALPSEGVCHDIVKQYLNSIYTIRIRSVG